MSKYCSKCGTMLSDTTKFCSKCGNPVTTTENNQQSYNQTQNQQSYNYPTVNFSQNRTQEEPVAPKNKEKKKMSVGKKILIIFILLLSLVIALVVTFATLYFTGPAYTAYKSIDNQKYSEALLTYKYDVSDNFLQNTFLKIALSGYEQTIIDKYNNDELEFDSAIEGLNTLQEMNICDATKAIEDINNAENVNKALENGENYYSSGNYESAIKEYSSITSDNENYETAQSKLNEIYPKYISYIEETVNSYISSNNYQGALTLLNTAEELIPDSIDTSSFTTLREDCLLNYTSDVIDSVTKQLNAGEYTEALTSINKAIDVNENEEFKKLKSTIETKYMESVTSQVNSYLDSEDYISASRVANNALSILPDNSQLQELKKKVEDNTPTYLLDACKPYAVDDYTEFINGETFNMGGKTFTNGFSLSYSGYANFNTESKYKTLNLSVGHVDDTRMEDCTIKIYCDNVLKYEEKYSSDALPKRISLDITGVNSIKFELADYIWGDYGFGNITVK